MKPKENPDAPASPFDMPEYVQIDAVAALDADRRADTHFQKALENRQRGDNYTLLAVAFATVLFFAAISGRVKKTGSAWFLLGVGLVLFVGVAGTLLFFPKII